MHSFPYPHYDDGAYRLTPLFHGMKSSWFSCTALGMISPLAALMQYSKISSPIWEIVFLPSMMSPVLMSMISLIRMASLVLLDTFITGQTGFPVGVPKPVVNKISVAPLAAYPLLPPHRCQAYKLGSGLPF